MCSLAMMIVLGIQCGANHIHVFQQERMHNVGVAVDGSKCGSNQLGLELNTGPLHGLKATPDAILFQSRLD